ncbi:bifunctional phosphopantothenoylcysteine decarboxylase/phosphopantothenate--cysteine ligase CoaBC [Orrella daihaiensis]|uniref:Coenzyme A biosynthesis bifunctional protein CoaBC n=1 Tax=Orrella daihaiensis TaxID=2782176 RepID=A0ABY4AG73_9BURK|nr:bifunctional phosphopantothenoylcysteine decarboxylase/phosphopantothenate--cysteine ligase CoaBC [Orrella daihaiensis]UOD49257.1 bifunctional phosphopantothenoylcysteine decarboxylase/phosphopantothenate--cysteine ligase CoaBC [Orrella daihaiensis]
MGDLHNKHIVLGVSGGIACYKSAELVRRLMEQGATVDVVMTESACKFVTPVTFQALSGRPVYIDPWDNRAPNNMVHINLSRNADLVLIAPATANIIAKLANGMADDLLTTLCLASTKPLLIAPAMNREMWQAPATVRNIAQLKTDGIQILGPGTGEQACGETGDGRMLEPHELVGAVCAQFQAKTMQGLKILLTAGPTCEPIDPVRVITNRSSGKTGYALAQAAHEAGAQVTLISGPTNLPCPHGVTRLSVQTAQQMHSAVMKHANDSDIFIGVAAVADWRVANASSEKLKKTDGHPPHLEFVMNPDILAEVASLANGPWCVGFAAETSLAAKELQSKRQRKGVPILVANLAQQVMDTDHTTIHLVDETGMTALGTGHKLDVARQLMTEIVKRYRQHQA